ncbi:MAG: Rha family transcriptional regulator [Streptococcaceae bacterium]|jgi:Rha family phage regulatory protein|nr:Rha family transcriptional regulator [Streptococcaceae bacterium]
MESVANNQFNVIIQNKQAITTSLEVARVFHKRHDNILQKIDNILANSKLRALKMFIEGTYLDEQGKTRRMYYMNRDGFTFLVTGFTGKRADEFKILYIQTFNRMENELKKRLLNREIEQPTHNDLTSAIKEWEHLNKYSYSNLNSLLIKISTNLSIKQLREQRSDGLKAIGLDLLNSTEQERYLNLERVAIALIQADKDYAFIKSTLMAMSETEAML